jgi:tetratricopeptide (TPR) repeat protein
VDEGDQELGKKLADNEFRMGWEFFQKGDHKQALVFLKSSLSIRSKVFGQNHVDVAESLNYIGACENELCHYKEALENGKNSLAIRLKLFGENHTDVAQSYDNIGISLAMLGDHQKALEYGRKSLELRI